MTSVCDWRPQFTFSLVWSYIAGRNTTWHMKYIHYENWPPAANACILSIQSLINNPSITNQVLDFAVVHRSHAAFGFLRMGDSILKIILVYPPVFCWACVLLWLSVQAHCFCIASVNFDSLKRRESRWVVAGEEKVDPEQRLEMDDIQR